MVPRVTLQGSKYTFLSLRCQELSRSAGKGTKQMDSRCHGYFCMARIEERSHIPDASTAVLGLWLVLHQVSVLVMMTETREMDTSLEGKKGRELTWPLV